MKIKLIVFLTLVIMGYGHSQEKSKKQIKEEQKLEKQKQVEQIVNSMEFLFIAESVQPQGARNIILNNDSDTVLYTKNQIVSSLPYFGRAFSGSGYGGDGGMNFEGEPKDYKLKKGKKAYIINSSVKGKNDNYDLTLTIYFGGSAQLMITCANRSSISYAGRITTIKKDI